MKSFMLLKAGRSMVGFTLFTLRRVVPAMVVAGVAVMVHGCVVDVGDLQNSTSVTSGDCNPSQTPGVGPGPIATLSGFVTCSCFNGSFALTKDDNDVWSSPPINGCPGQTDTAYVKFAPCTNTLGIADQTSTPGSGNSDYSPGTVITTSPFKATGGGSKAGNINAFCPGSEDQSMSWTVTL